MPTTDPSGRSTISSYLVRVMDGPSAAMLLLIGLAWFVSSVPLGLAAPHSGPILAPVLAFVGSMVAFVVRIHGILALVSGVALIAGLGLAASLGDTPNAKASLLAVLPLAVAATIAVAVDERNNLRRRIAAGLIFVMGLVVSLILEIALNAWLALVLVLLLGAVALVFLVIDIDDLDDHLRHPNQRAELPIGLVMFVIVYLSIYSGIDVGSEIIAQCFEGKHTAEVCTWLQ